MLSVFFPSFLRSSSVCGRGDGGEVQNGYGRCDEFHELPLMARIKAGRVSTSSNSERPKAVMLHLQRLAVNRSGPDPFIWKLELA